jgi:hypothetical protein
VQPLAKPGVDQQNITAIAATISMALTTPVAKIGSHSFSTAVGAAHARAPFALICIRLI